VELIVVRERAEGLDGAGEAIEVPGADAGEQGEVTLARLEVLAGRSLVGVGREIQVGTPARGRAR